jgi:hypothetical protein
MLPAQAITEAIAALVTNEFAEYADRVYLNRTVALSEEQSDLTGVAIRQGADEPFDDASTFDRMGMSLAVEVSFLDTSNDEGALVATLNELRRRLHRRLIARDALGLSFVMVIAFGGAAAPVSNNAASTVAIELLTRWSVLYTMDRFNPDA